MPTFEITAPDGQTYEVTGDTAEGAAAALQQSLGAPPLAPQQTADPGVAGSVDAFGRGIANMALLGYADEIGAGADYLGSNILPWREPKTWEQALQDTRASDAAVAAEHPVADIAGQGAGLIGGGSLLAKGLQAGRIGYGANLAANAPLTTQALAAAKDAAAIGAVSGFGQGQDGFVNRAESAGVGGLVGAALGPALTYAGAGISRVANALKDSRAAKAASQATGLPPPAVRYLANQIEQGQALGANGQANMARAGSNAMLADASPTMANALDTMITEGGGGGLVARQRIEQRAARGNADFTAARDMALGTPSGKYIVPPAEKAAISAAYPKAYSQPIDYSHPLGQEIEQIVKTRVPSDAIAAAERLSRIEGNPLSLQKLATQNPDGTFTITSLPDVRQLDYITRGLNDVAQRENAAGGLMGGTTQTGRAYSNLSGEIRDRLRQLVPEYGNALDLAGTEIGKVNASKLGQTILSPSTSRDDVREIVKTMGGTADKEVAARSMSQWIDDQMANVRRAFSDPNIDARQAAAGLRALSSDASREKVEMVIGPQRAKDFFDRLDEIAPSFELKAAVSQNSKTAQRLAGKQVLEDLSAPGILEQGVGAITEPLATVQNIGKAARGQSPAQLIARNQKNATSIAEFLTRPAQQARADFGELANYNNQLSLNQLYARRVADALMRNQSGAYLLGGNPTSTGKR